MRTRMLALVAAAAISAVMLLPDPAAARGGFGGGFRGGGFGGFRGAAIGGFRGGFGGFRGPVGFRTAGIGWRGAGWGVRPGWGWGRGWGWRRGWGWGAAAVGAGLVAGSYYGYPYGYDYYPAAYGGYGYGGCVLQPRPVWTGWGYRQVLVQVCY